MVVFALHKGGKGLGIGDFSGANHRRLLSSLAFEMNGVAAM